jgi:hypothetical protein
MADMLNLDKGPGLVVKDIAMWPICEEHQSRGEEGFYEGKEYCAENFVNKARIIRLRGSFNRTSQDFDGLRQPTGVEKAMRGQHASPSSL